MPFFISKSDSDEKLRQKVKEISGENFQKCYQCGTCSGSCPMADHMTVVPRRLMALLQLGNRAALDEANTPWVCASCHACMVRCPRSIDIPKVMEAVRQLKIRDRLDRIEPGKIDKKQIADMPQIAMVSGFRKLTS